MNIENLTNQIREDLNRIRTKEESIKILIDSGIFTKEGYLNSKYFSEETIEKTGKLDLSNINIDNNIEDTKLIKDLTVNQFKKLISDIFIQYNNSSNNINNIPNGRLQQVLLILKELVSNIEITKEDRKKYYDIEKFIHHKETCKPPRGDQICDCGCNSVLYNIEQLLDECEGYLQSPLKQAKEILKKYNL